MATAFTIGKTYWTRSICYSDCVFSWKVTKRTAKFITLDDGRGKVRRAGVRSWQGVETASPLGSYSMCPVISADEFK